MQRDAFVSAKIPIWRQESYAYLCAFGYGESPVVNLGAFTIAIHTGDRQQPLMATCQVTDTRGYLILGSPTLLNQYAANPYKC